MLPFPPSPKALRPFKHPKHARTAYARNGCTSALPCNGPLGKVGRQVLIASARFHPAFLRLKHPHRHLIAAPLIKEYGPDAALVRAWRYTVGRFRERQGDSCLAARRRRPIAARFCIKPRNIRCYASTANMPTASLSLGRFTAGTTWLPRLKHRARDSRRACGATGRQLAWKCVRIDIGPSCPRRGPASEQSKSVGHSSAQLLTWAPIRPIGNASTFLLTEWCKPAVSLLQRTRKGSSVESAFWLYAVCRTRQFDPHCIYLLFILARMGGSSPWKTKGHSCHRMPEVGPGVSPLHQRPRAGHACT